MTRALTIYNDTHWKSSDILRIVRAARTVAGLDPSRPMEVYVRWMRHPGYVFRFSARDPISIYVRLPRRGAKTLHPNAMLALAAASIESSTPILPVADSFHLANFLAWEFSRLTETPDKTLEADKDSINPPAWGRDLIISKYADPAKDGAFQDFVAKKEGEIARIQARVDKWTAEKNRADKNLSRALKDLRATRRGLQEAKRRRGL